MTAFLQLRLPGSRFIPRVFVKFRIGPTRIKECPMADDAGKKQAELEKLAAMLKEGSKQNAAAIKQAEAIMKKIKK